MGIPEDSEGWLALVRRGMPPFWRLMAESTGGRRNRIDTLLVCRVDKPSDDGAEEPSAPSGKGATRWEEPAQVEG